ncbi:hypothetical protein F53441_4232 [Fusarium austroafricanum]|uniref:Uncharacterized protein n=1 Tax=Fusarium austroafricanum TaxID=2364996 RepID=A0A8H4P1X6_9HYPO|nr:hypothetical protein F53441_4232 [Fusarium austroafricanum]
MATPKTMTDDEVANQHFTLTSEYFTKKFDEPFPGLQPSLAQRRSYMRAFCQWYRWQPDFESVAAAVREKSTIVVSQLFLEKGFKNVRKSLFEWSVDRWVWISWFMDMTDAEKPLWPWVQPPKPEEGEGASPIFAKLKQEYDRKGSLVDEEAVEREKAAIVAKRAAEAEAAAKKAAQVTKPSLQTPSRPVASSAAGPSTIRPVAPQASRQVPQPPPATASTKTPIASMEKEDIRKVLDGPTAKHVHNIMLTSHLALTLPVEGYEASGVDCLVNLTRHCNSMLCQPSSTQIEEENPVLSYAWQTFYPIEVDAALAENRVAVKKSLLEHLGGRIPERLTFEECNKSNLMNETLWSSEEWLLHSSDRSDATLAENRREGGAASLIEYNCLQNPGWQLQDAVDHYCTSRQKQDNLSRRDPVFVRVHYHAHTLQPRSFLDLVSFELPLADGKRSRRSFLVYSLTTIVKMRRKIIHRDELRTYDQTGCPVRRDNPQTWRVTDTGGMSYLLAYVLGVRDPAQVNHISRDVNPECPVKYQLVPEYEYPKQAKDHDPNIYAPDCESSQQFQTGLTDSNDREPFRRECRAKAPSSGY